MRKITIDAIRAFRTRTNFKRGNTKVVHHYDETHLLLHGHLIASYSEHGGLFISSAGHPTMTTKERLNGLPNVNIHQKNFQWFLNGEEWDGSRIKV
tara:strand:- start:20 stop:307 length:288 start_codon:yes stop_codon:yes gene_type:complete